MITQHPHVVLVRGSPMIRDSSIPVRRLWAWVKGGATIETILREYSALGPARVLDALAFAYDNQAVIDAELDAEFTRNLPP